MFKCSSCSYQSDRKFNLKKHIISMHQRDVDDDEIKQIDVDTNNTDHSSNTLTEQIEEPQNQCGKCGKILSSPQSIKRHEKICKGISNILECHFCHNVFSSQQSKSKHIKVCKVNKIQGKMQALMTHIAESNHIIQPTNTNTIINYNYHDIKYNLANERYRNKYVYDLGYADVETINDFGHEDTSYISREQWHEIAAYHKLKTLILLKHFHPDHPENHNIRRYDKKSYKILKDKVWTAELKEVVHNDILEKVRVDASEYAKIHVTPFLNGEKEEVFLSTCVNHDKRHKKIIFSTIEAKVEELFEKFETNVYGKNSGIGIA